MKEEGSDAVNAVHFVRRSTGRVRGSMRKDAISMGEIRQQMIPVRDRQEGYFGDLFSRTTDLLVAEMAIFYFEELVFGFAALVILAARAGFLKLRDDV
jgi:hypothetical protein